MAIKTLEQIRLERIQEESAAFYSYDSSTVFTLQNDKADTSRPMGGRKLPSEYESMSLDEIHGKRGLKRQVDKSDDFKVLTLGEIRALKKRKTETEISSPLRHLNVTFNGRDYKIESQSMPASDISLEYVKPVNDEALEACLKAFKSSPPTPKLRKSLVQGIPSAKPKLKRKILIDNEKVVIKRSSISSFSNDNVVKSQSISNEINSNVDECASNSFNISETEVQIRASDVTNKFFEDLRDDLDISVVNSYTVDTPTVARKINSSHFSNNLSVVIPDLISCCTKQVIDVRLEKNSTGSIEDEDELLKDIDDILND